MVQVYLYAFIFEVTNVDHARPFPWQHYVLPVFFSLSLLAVSIVTPVEYQVQVIKSQGGCPSGAYQLFCAVSNSKMPVRFALSLFYIVLGFWRLRRYRKVVANLSSNEDKSQLHWISGYLFMSTILIPLIIIGYFFENRSFVVSSLAMIGYNLLFIIQYVYLCYFVIKERYVVWPDATETKETEETILQSENVLLKKNVLTREGFEHYIQTQKPYLNSDLKITDLVENLNVNRTYISTFINNEFQMNFSAYINQYRFEEYLKLAVMPEHKDKPKRELAAMAGFSSYKSFQRYRLSENSESEE
jgi:AraC-like DNA-binding protein